MSGRFNIVRSGETMGVVALVLLAVVLLATGYERGCAAERHRTNETLTVALADADRRVAGASRSADALRSEKQRMSDQLQRLQFLVDRKQGIIDSMKKQRFVRESRVRRRR